MIFAKSLAYAAETQQNFFNSASPDQPNNDLPDAKHFHIFNSVHYALVRWGD
jgi:hypothetical protein